MWFIKNIRLRNKMFLAFGMVTLILIGVLLFGTIGLFNIETNLSNYTTLSQVGDLTVNIQSNLLSSRLAFKNFLEKKDSSQDLIFDEHYKSMKSNIYDYKQIEKSKERLFSIDNIATLNKPITLTSKP